MFESKQIKDLLVQNDPQSPDFRERRVQEIVESLKENQFDSTMPNIRLKKEHFEYMAFLDKAFFCLAVLTSLPLISFLCYKIKILPNELFTDFRVSSFNVIDLKLMLYLVSATFTLILVFFIFDFFIYFFVKKEKYFLKYRRNSRKIKNHYYNQVEILNSTKELIQVLMDKPYEVRVEYLETAEKIKVVVEKNLQIEGTSSVIKSSPESLTSYVDVFCSYDKIVKACVEIAKTAEARFSK